MMQATWEFWGVWFAVIVVGGLGGVGLVTHLRRGFALLIPLVRKTPARSAFGLLAVGVALAYGGSKPPAVVQPAFSYQVNADDTITLLTVTNAPTSSALAIPAEYASRRVTALAKNFCAQASVAARFGTVSIPASVKSIGEGFFGFKSEAGKALHGISVDSRNAYCRVTDDGVLYELGTGRMIYAIGEVETVRFKVSYRSGSRGQEGERVVYKAYGQPLIIADALFTCKEEEPQIGWAQTDRAAKIGYAFGAVYTQDEPLTLYPVWPAKTTCTVIVDPMGGTGEFGPFEFELEKDVSLPLCTLEKSGYVFAGWSRWPNGRLEWDDGQAGLNPALPITIRLYAIWLKPNSYGIAFVNEVDGPGLMDYQSVGVGKVAKLNSCPVAKRPAGKTKFVGWRKVEIGRTPCEPRLYDDEMLVFDLASAGEIVLMMAVWQ